MKSQQPSSTRHGRHSRLAIGLISGTSADGIDAVLIRISGHGSETKLQQLAFLTHRYPEGFREFLLSNSLPGTSSVDTICRLHAVLGEFFADAARRVCATAHIPLRRISLIGSHGQTVHHLPGKERIFGKDVRSTLQLGDPSVIAARTGVITVGDFRSADVAHGGQGAPLVPFLDFVVFRSAKTTRLLLNLGGIANFTVLPRNCGLADVRAFDTGPANMIIDALTRRFFDKPFDRNGAVAAAGRVSPALLQWMMSHSYLHRQPPKSTGREEFGATFVRELLKKSNRLLPADIVATATEFTALSVYDQYVRYVRRRTPVDEVLVSGGGVHNRTLMRLLQFHFGSVPVHPVELSGCSSDAKEAILFALLANETLHGAPGNIPGVTGAARAVVLGKICLP